MKKNIRLFFFCISIILAHSAWADIETMHLSWTISDSSDITQYKLYYSSSADMAGKIWHTECSNPTEETSGSFSMTCTNIDINSFPAYIQVAAVLNDLTEITSNIQTIPEDPTKSPPRLSTVKDFRIISSPPTDGTVFYWNMDKLPATTMLSDVGNITITKHQNDGTSSPGVTGNCLQQTGTWQTYRFPMSVVPADQGTITFWARHDYPPDIGDSNTRYFFRSTNIDSANTIKAYTYKNNIYFYIYDNTGTLHRTYKVADTWNTGTWYQYSFSWDAATGSMTIKRDGVVLSEASTPPWDSALPMWGSQDLYIGYLEPLGSFDEFNITNN